MSSNRLYTELIQACAKPGCPLCHLSLTFARRYLDAVLHEQVNDTEVRANLRAARGYCNTHAWMLSEGRGIVLSVAILQHDLLNTVIQATDPSPQGRDARRSARHILQRLHPTAECPACVNQRTMEDLALQTMLEHLSDPQLAAALDQTPGLCLPHFARALELVTHHDQLDRLLHFQRAALTRLRDQLAELIRKHDYRYTDLELGPEGNSWQRALGIMAGERGLPWKQV